MIAVIALSTVISCLSLYALPRESCPTLAGSIMSAFDPEPDPDPYKGSDVFIPSQKSELGRATQSIM